MKLQDCYTTYDYESRVELCSSSFTAQEYASVADAYAECIGHELECLKSGDYTIIDVIENEIVFSDRNGCKSVSVVTMYDEDGNLVPYRG